MNITKIEFLFWNTQCIGQPNLHHNSLTYIACNLKKQTFP